MNENEIRSGLASKVESPVEKPQEPKTPPAIQDRGYAPFIGNDIEETRIFDYYQVPQADRITDGKPKLQYLVDWAASKVGNSDPLAVMEYLKGYDNVFMLPPARRFQRLYEYAKLDKELMRFQQEVAIYG